MGLSLLVRDRPRGKASSLALIRTDPRVSGRLVGLTDALQAAPALDHEVLRPAPWDTKDPVRQPLGARADSHLQLLVRVGLRPHFGEHELYLRQRFSELDGREASWQFWCLTAISHAQTLARTGFLSESREIPAFPRVFSDRPGPPSRGQRPPSRFANLPLCQRRPASGPGPHSRCRAGWPRAGPV